jgi:putative polyketide hydroxylase
MQGEQAEALVVGGGPAGLAAAIELTDLGIEPLLLERRTGPWRHPRATALTAPAMQMMWRWGVAAEVTRAGFPAEPAMSIRTSLTAPELDRAPLSGHVWSCPQDQLEDILAIRATAGGARISCGTQLIGLRPEDETVTATAATTGGVAAGIRAGYVVGADGTRSTVRQACDIGITRARHLGHWISILFRSPLRDYLSDPPFMRYRIEDPGGECAEFVPADAGDRWLHSLPWHPERGQRAGDYDAERCIALIRSVAGLADLPVQIIGIKSLEHTSCVATQFSAARTVLAGDAAHTIDPAVGQSLTLALQDGAGAAEAISRALAAGGDEAGPLADYDLGVRQRVDQVLSRELVSC